MVTGPLAGLLNQDVPKAQEPVQTDPSAMPQETAAEAARKAAEERALVRKPAQGVSRNRLEWVRNQALVPVELMDLDRELADQTFASYWGTLSVEEQQQLAPYREVYYQRRKILDQLDLTETESYAAEAFADLYRNRILSPGAAATVGRMVAPLANSIKFFSDQLGLEIPLPEGEQYLQNAIRYLGGMRGESEYVGDEGVLAMLPKLLHRDVPKELREQPHLFLPTLAMAMMKGRERRKLGLQSKIPPEVDEAFQTLFEEQGGLAGEAAGLLGYLAPAGWAARGAGAAALLATGGRSALPLLSQMAGFGLAGAGVEQRWGAFPEHAAFGGAAHVAGGLVGRAAGARTGPIARGLRGEKGLAAYPARAARETAALGAGEVAADVVGGHPVQVGAETPLIAALFGLRGHAPAVRPGAPETVRTPQPPRTPRVQPPQPPRPPRVQPPQPPQPPRVRPPEPPRGPEPPRIAPPRGPTPPRAPRGPEPPRAPRVTPPRGPRGPRAPEPPQPKTEGARRIEMEFQRARWERPIMPPRPEIPLPERRRMGEPRPLAPRPEAPPPEARPEAPPERRRPLEEWSYPELQAHAKKLGIPARQKKPELIKSIKKETYQQRDKALSDFVEDAFGKKLYEVPIERIGPELERRGVKVSHEMGWRLMASQRRAILQARREGKKVPPEVLGPHGIKEKLTEAEQKELERAKKLTEGFFHPFGKPAKGKKTGPSEWEPIPGTIMERRKLRGKGASQYIEEGGLYRMRNPLWNRRPRQPQYITVRAERKLEGIKWEGTNLATGRKIRFSIHRIQDQVRQREKAPEAGPQASLGVEGEPGGLRGAVEAAPKVFPKGRQEKRYISDVWEAYRKQTGEDISLPEFKRMLWAEHAKGKEGTVRLSRADLVEAMEATKVKASEFQASPTARFHLVELREPVPGLRLPRKGEGREGGFLDLEAIRQTISKGAKMPARMISDLAQHVVNTLGAAARSFDSVYSFLRRTFGEKVSRYARDIWDAVTARLSTIVRRKYRAPEPHLDPRQPKLSEPVVQKVVDDRYQTSYVEWMRGVGDWFKDLLKTQGPLGEELVAKFSEAVRIRYLFEGYLWNPKGPNIGKVLRVTGRPFMTSGMMGPKRKDGFLAFSRFHDLMEGRAKPANNRELAVYTPYRNLLDQTWDAMRAMGLKRYNHRTGEMEPLPPRPKGGDILPAKFSPEFFEVLRTIDSSHALAQRLTREIARVNQKAGYEHINQKYVEGWYERFREAIDTTNVKPGRSVKQINAEFMREIPILPSYMQWGKMAGFRRWIPILESNPFYYAQQYGRQAAARMGFIKAFGEDIKLGELRKQFGQEGGNQKRFDQAMRAVQELPIYIAKFDPEARMLLKPITNAWKGIVDLYRTRMLSRATVAVAAETGFGPTTVFFGITPQAKAAGRRAVNAIANLIRKDRKSAIETLNSLGVGIDLLPNYSFNPRAPWTSLTRMVSDFVQRNIILFTRASIAHERHVGLSAREYIDQIMRYAPGKKVPAWLKPYKLFRSVFNIDLTALKNLGFSLDEAMRIRKGEVSMSDLQRATQNAAAAMTGGRRPSLHDSPFGKNPYSRFFFFFTDYARVRIRQLMVVSRSVSDAYRIAKSNQYTKLQKLDAMRNAGMSFARFFGYSTLQGFSYMFAAAALRGGPGDEEDGPWPGVDILLSDAKDRPFHNIMMANFYAGVLGPFGSLVYFSATDHPLVSAAKVTGPGSIVVEAIEFAEGWGSYRDQELLERAATMFERRTPIGPLATTWAAVLGIGSKNAALEEAWSARWRYFYDAGLIKPGYMTTRGAKADEEHARFRMEMRRAANALRSEQYDLADEYLIRAIGHKLETPRSVRDSLLMKRALWNFETRLTPEQEEGLRKRIGEQAYLQLLHWDTVIEAFARAYSGL